MHGITNTRTINRANERKADHGEKVDRELRRTLQEHPVYGPDPAKMYHAVRADLSYFDRAAQSLADTSALLDQLARPTRVAPYRHVPTHLVSHLAWEADQRRVAEYLWAVLARHAQSNESPADDE